MSRKIIHIDMDCFFAAVEIRDNPQLAGRPIAVGGLANSRGVLSTCNYEARKFGLHSAMSTARALILCPQLIVLPVAMEKYRVASQKIHRVFQRYTKIVEPISLDEAYLDVTDCPQCQGSATWLANQIREEITQATQLTASAGIASNKFLAKVASDWNKPNGQLSIAPDQIAQFIQTLSVKKIPGVGRVTAKKLTQLGVETCVQLQALSKNQLSNSFGKFGRKLYDYSRGIDDRRVESSRIRKSVSVERTFPYDLKTLIDCESRVVDLYQALCVRLKKHSDRVIHKQFIKIKFSDFTQITKECVVATLTEDVFINLLHKAIAQNKKPIRLLGAGVRFLEQVELQQYVLSLQSAHHGM